MNGSASSTHAHKNLTDLTAQVTTLRDVLANKQTRGAFGQARMEAIVQDGLPSGSYEFQATLSNGTRPDCLVRLPDGEPARHRRQVPAGSVDRAASRAPMRLTSAAARRLRNDVLKHVRTSPTAT